MCTVKEDNYQGPTHGYPCMKNYLGPKIPDVKCKGKHGCFRKLTVYDGKKVIGGGGCFDFAKKACIEEVTKAKFDDKGCIPETTIEPPMMVELKSKCELDEPLSNVAKGATAEGGGGRRRKREGEAEEPKEPGKAIICVCEGDLCNNMAAGSGRSTGENGASIPSPSGFCTGVISGVSLVGGSLFLKRRA